MQHRGGGQFRVGECRVGECAWVSTVWVNAECSMGELTVGEVAPELTFVELILVPRQSLKVRRGAACPGWV